MPSSAPLSISVIWLPIDRPSHYSVLLTTARQ